MKRTLLIPLALTAVIATATGCGASSVAHPSAPATAPAKATTSPAPPPAVAAQGHSECAELSGTVRTDQTCHVQSTTSAYKIDMSFPLDYPDLRAVTDFLKHDRDQFLDWVTNFGPSDRRGRAYQYTVTAKAFRSGTRESGTQSLVLEIDNDTGSAHEGHPNTTFQAFNFDLGKHAPITYYTLFKPGTQPLEVLNPIVRRKFNAPAAELTEKAYRDFALTDEAVIFFFGQDQVVPDNNGPKKITVPRDELASLLA